MDLSGVISKRKKLLWNRPELNDVNFIFPLSGSKSVSSNKTILALCSPVFDVMFFSTYLAERGPEGVTIPDVEAEIFEEFLR